MDMNVNDPAGKAAQHDESSSEWDADSVEESVQDPSEDADAQAKDQSESDTDSQGSSEDDSEQDAQQPGVLDAYRRLLSRRVDLVGDYAGDELFLIEGDSLLLQCFADSKLDFDPGFQLLHAVYSVEQFLHQLNKRKCNFHIVFLDSNRDLCIPSTARSDDVCKYHLARDALIHHLKVNLPRSHPSIAINTFPSYGSKEFAKYLSVTGPYFLMVHDGAQPLQRQSKHMEDDLTEAEPSDQKVALRLMILNLIGRGYNIALINGLEWRDTKVMTMILEARHRTTTVTYSAPADDTRTHSEPLDVSGELQKLSGLTQPLTERQTLAVIALSKLIADPPSSVSQDSLPSLCCVFLLHLAYLAHLPLSARRLQSTSGAESAQEFLRAFVNVANRVLQSLDSVDIGSGHDLMDAVDGRIFLHLSQNTTTPPDEVGKVLNSLLAALEHLSRSKLETGFEHNDVEPGTDDVRPPQQDSEELVVMPFSNQVFDKHLEPVRLKVDEAAGDDQTIRSHRIFKELTHWHNAKKPIIQKGPPTAASAKAEFWKAKREQLFMAEMRTYAASLTNAIGKSLDPETIIVGATKAAARETPVVAKTKSVRETQSPEDSDSAASSSKAKAGGKKAGGGGKTAQKNAGKQAMLAQIEAKRAKKEESTTDKTVTAWHTVCKTIEAEKDPRSRFQKAKAYWINLQPAGREVIEAECQLFALNCVLQYWIEACRRREQDRRIEITALIWNLAQQVMGSKGLTKDIISKVELTVKTLNIPQVPEGASDVERKLGFKFALPATAVSLAVNLPSKDFQLLHCGPYMERSFDSRPDSRVEFKPDGWQRKVLDGIDANQSVFVVAPTSAGKTFISFYAMRKVLEADDEGVLVYVAPTKALVNQIAAEIQARYSKSFKQGGKSVWAIHTRDYRINNPTGCQVLVTVPHVLQIMLLAPSNANKWSSRVRRIIFDEVHSIGQAEDGVVWEQLLLMSPCPIIALSATVGNPQEFSKWLTDTQKSIGIDLVTVQHPHRYSDLRKFYYTPPEKFAFQGIPEKESFGVLGLDGLTGFHHVHPVAGLIDKSRGIPQDLGLEPRDCLNLWKAMVKHETAAFPVPEHVNPAEILPTVCRKVDTLNWEKELKLVLQNWMVDSSSPYDAVVRELEQNFRNDTRELEYATKSTELTSSHITKLQDPYDLIKTTLPLLCRLQAHDALPAILFNYDRHQCEKICKAVLEQLQDAELAQKKSGPKWEKTLERWEDWKKIREKAAAKQSKAKKAKPQDDDKGSKLDQQRDAADDNAGAWDLFDPAAPADGYHFADYTRLQRSELDDWVRQLGKRDIGQWLIDALQRGIGVHHAGMNRKYRQAVEILFRRGFLRVIIATGTLALGINMPCKTVVFSGDSVFLTALNYRQCAGRAGRRGFDLLGNVVFHGVAREKVCRLISSRLPDLSGHFPITTTLVLRLFTLLSESKNSKYAVSAINALLSQPRLYMGGPSFKDQTMHHLRFSIEYLRRQFLLSTNGVPLNFAGLVSHLYFTENSSFAFHALLKEGYFHELCGGVDKNEKDITETLMLVMAHLFNRIECRQADSEYREKVVKPSSSIVFLPPLPATAADILRQHNKQTLDVYRTYVKTFIQQHIHDDDCSLPLVGVDVGNQEANGVQLPNALPPAKIRSPFVALSGPGDDFESIHDLCHTLRDGVFLEEAVVPHVDVYPDEMDVPLNAWLLDFFKHGDVTTIERANGIRKADIWFLLNDFSLVLATIITSLLNFMKLKEGTDLDMLDVMGDLEIHDEAEENTVATSEAPQPGEPASASGVAGGAVSSIPERSRLVAKKKAKNADSWEEVADEENDIARAEERRAAHAARLQSDVNDALGEAVNGEGLREVLKAFQKLHAEFNIKFRAMWA
ncbi:DEAD/DEAH box helicase [Seiridium cupressi]